MESLDNEGQTPLHWACYQGADEAIYYLLAWVTDMNIQDKHGKTAMHQAVEQIHRYAHYRPLKEMLIKGSLRSIKDYNGKTPIDLIPPTTSPSSQEELVKILGKQPISIPCFQIKTPLKKLQRSYTTMSNYVVFMLGTFI